MKKESLPGFLRTEEAFSNVRYVGDMRSAKEVGDQCWCFFDVLVPCIVGKKIWTNQRKMAERITESNCVMVVDEAFTVLCIENYWNKWVNGGGHNVDAVQEWQHRIHGMGQRSIHPLCGAL